MAVREIIRMGHPTLRKVARKLRKEEIVGKDIRTLVDDMVDTLHASGGIGLAAPQINESVQLAIIQIPKLGSRYGVLEELPLTVFVNPEISVVADAESAGNWEGCLSVPGLRGWVERPQHINLQYQDLDGVQHAREFTGFHATVCQHELDHLTGHLFVDRMTDMTKLVFEDLLVPEDAYPD
ncbi:MAG: peptide deformylase [Gammaproteobacteria bacterium]|nr:peptide deformylase [Gammaproteobacteria bacterium]